MKTLVSKLWFLPKENSNNIFTKKYQNGYLLEIDLDKMIFDFGWDILVWKNITQNITKSEDWVVLECVNRLLEKWYKPKDIILEKVYPTGHNTSWRLDILVQKEWKTFLMIECKTWGKEYEKELKNMQSKWGQLFTYFQQDRDAEYLVLYASDENGKYRNDIVKIEEAYKETSNVADLYERWNKLTKENGIFDEWTKAYDFEARALVYSELDDIKEEDSSYIFNRFLEILRHNTVSDKPNAFNKMFTLFLCKIYDELDKQDTPRELEFQWVEWKDDNISFQKKLTDLYKKWMAEFLSKQVTDFSDEDFEKQFWSLIQDKKEKEKLLQHITKLRLQKNNEFAIKEVFDDESFEENAKVLKEIVELLQWYKFRYAKKQPFLWDFFELLLTTGLKQEAGQFFTPVPIARFICKSIPIESIIDDKLNSGNNSDLLPTFIDYAAGSGHFIIEWMEEVQEIINNKKLENFNRNIRDEFDTWKSKPYTWAKNYAYGIEKDYRLVRTSKVWCYLHGDGIATVIHGDGLDNFESSKDYKWVLKNCDSHDKKQNKSFDLVLSNPPYSVSSFKWNMKRELAENDFTLFNQLTDTSSEIEALFIERTSQLLKEGWIAAIILPSSILSNTGIYTKAREIILKDFEIIAITELGSNTFMATGTNTVTLFLRKRSQYFARDLQNSVNEFFKNKSDITMNGVENTPSKYISEVWEWISFDDYKTLLSSAPNDAIQNHEIYKEYENKLKSKKLIEDILEIEKEKLFYFALSYAQTVVLVKTGEKKIEKEFLGYEFSNRKWSEWIHPTQRGKQIDECTKLFDPDSLHNPEKASTYIYEAFERNHKRQIDSSLKDHIFRLQLSDLLTFDRVDFEKTISLSTKKKVSYNQLWWTDKLTLLWDISHIKKWTSITSRNIKAGNIPVVAWWQKPAYYHNQSNRDGNIITVSASWAYSWFVNYFSDSIFASDCNTIKSKDENAISTKLIYEYLKSIQDNIYDLQRWQAQPHVYWDDLSLVKIPLPPKDIQQKIVDEIWELEKVEEYNLKNIWELEDKIGIILSNIEGETTLLWDVISLEYWKWLKASDRIKWEYPVVGANWIVWFHNEFITDNPAIIVWRKWSAWKVNYFHKNCFPIDTTFYVKLLWNDLLKFIYFILTKNNLELLVKGSWVPWLNRNDVYNLKIPLPPLETQKQIVVDIEVLEKEIEKLKQENNMIPEQKQEILKKYL